MVNRTVLGLSLLGTMGITALLMAAGQPSRSTTGMPASESPPIAQPKSPSDPASRIQFITRDEAIRMGIPVPPPPPTFPDQRSRSSVLPSTDQLDSGVLGENIPPSTTALPSSDVTENVGMAVVGASEDEGGEYFHDIEPPPYAEGDAPPIESECDSDFDGSGKVDAVDLLGYVNAWFALSSDEPERMDYNDNGKTEIEDLMLYLNGWFAGCA